MSALLRELAALKAADAGAKAVVFSSWGRLLRLVGDALGQVRRWESAPALLGFFVAELGQQGCPQQLPPACARAPPLTLSTSLLLASRVQQQNGVRYATLAGANPTQREEALHAFLHDPACSVLTVRGAARRGAVWRECRGHVVEQQLGPACLPASARSPPPATTPRSLLPPPLPARWSCPAAAAPRG